MAELLDLKALRRDISKYDCEEWNAATGHALLDRLEALEIVAAQLAGALSDMRRRVADGVRFPEGSTDLADDALTAAAEMGIN